MLSLWFSRWIVIRWISWLLYSWRWSVHVCSIIWLVLGWSPNFLEKLSRSTLFISFHHSIGIWDWYPNRFHMKAITRAIDYVGFKWSNFWLLRCLDDCNINWWWKRLVNFILLLMQTRFIFTPWWEPHLWRLDGEGLSGGTSTLTLGNTWSEARRTLRFLRQSNRSWSNDKKIIILMVY